MQEKELREYGYIMDGSTLVSYIGVDSAIMLPADITEIEERAFYGNPIVKAVVIPQTVKSIGDYAFGDCPNLEYVSIGEGLRMMGEGVFYGCKALKAVDILGELLQIPPRTFSECQNLIYAFLPANFTVIGTEAFKDCYQLAHLYIPTMMKEIQDGAFEFCNPLIRYAGSRWDWHFGVKKGKQAFPKRLSVDFVRPGKKVDTFKMFRTDLKMYSQFKNATNGFFGLSMLFGGKSETKKKTKERDLISEALQSPISFSGIQFAVNDTEPIKAKGYKYSVLAIPDNVDAVNFSESEYADRPEFVVVQPGNPAYYSRNGHLIEKNSGRLIIGSGSEDIPSNAGIKEIGNRGFLGGKQLCVHVPEGVTKIENAFIRCDYLQTVVLPSSLIEIGQDAFYRNESLYSLIIPANVKTIAKDWCRECPRLVSLAVEGGGNANYHSRGNCLIETASGRLVFGCSTGVISSDGSVKAIGAFAFAEKKIAEVCIPSSVVQVEEVAFDRCFKLAKITIEKGVSLLEHGSFFAIGTQDIFYTGSMEEWEAIEKKEDWRNISKRMEIHCNNGTITLEAITPPQVTVAGAIPDGTHWSDFDLFT